ncbi:hypothetical protein QTJ16_004826 [Diplocarpon rosae]|uniref:EKC/KEOPS complex subunit CGI121 n=1 Tax=Diplocarpon rosae TaxID=946125 RepID=A0AAD9SYM3_9HELO|nr:hypothetical protein QTJ16_004826 [Diplocarpon rosae]
MALLQTIHLEHLPTSYELHIALYHNVTNAAFLHQQLLTSNTEFEYTFLDASVILSRVHILAAAYRAINDMQENRLRTRNVHSEIVFSLSPNNNISESFRRFGITPATASLLVLKLSTPTSPFPAADVQVHLASAVSGDQVAFTDQVLEKMTDLARVRKIYKANGGAGGKGRERGHVGGNGAKVSVKTEVGKEERERRELEVLVLGAMALRSLTN